MFLRFADASFASAIDADASILGRRRVFPKLKQRSASRSGDHHDKLSTPLFVTDPAFFDRLG